MILPDPKKMAVSNLSAAYGCGTQAAILPLLALTAQRDLEGTLVGFSMYKEGTILVRLEAGPPSLERVLEHEWGHMFGAAHIADRASIMDSLLQGGEFGALNARAIRLHREVVQGHRIQRLWRPPCL